MKQAYEAVVVLNPILSGDRLESSIRKVEEVIKRNGGAIQNSLRWGKRRLAYKIKKQKEGFYLFIEFQAESTKLNEMTGAYRLMEEVLRFLLLVQKSKKNAQRLTVPSVAQGR